MALNNEIMGRTYFFECPLCGYRARVAGGADAGAHLAVQTILCNDCHALYDAVVGLRTVPRKTDARPKAAPSFDAAINRLPPRGKLVWLTFKPVCPVAAWHQVRPWKQPGQCPRCGYLLEPDGIPYRRWD